jgi:acyl carrier protein
MDDVYQRVVNILEQFSGIDCASINPQEYALGDLDVDSMDLLQIGLDLEEEFDIEIPDSAVRANMTVGELVESVRALIENKTNGVRS